MNITRQTELDNGQARYGASVKNSWSIKKHEENGHVSYRIFKDNTFIDSFRSMDEAQERLKYLKSNTQDKL